MAHLGFNTFTSSIDGDSNSDLIYYNASIINNQTNISSDAPNPQIRFQETRDTPILNDCSKYHFSIVRFSLNGPNKDLPLFIPVIRTGVDNPTNDVNLTIYSVSITMTVNYTVLGVPYTNTFTSTQPLIYFPETLDISVAPVPSSLTIANGKQDISTRYYWVYTYGHWLQIVNNALASCISNVSVVYPGIQQQFNAWWVATAIPGAPPTLQTTTPLMQYDNKTYLFKLYADRISFGGSARLSAGTPTDEDSTLYFNSNMFGLFANFDNNYVNLSSERTNEILVYPKLYQNILSVASPPAPTAISYWIMEQDYESVSTLWCPIESIVFLSSLLPVVNETTGDPISFGNSNVGESGNTQSAFQPIITDIQLPGTNGFDYREYIQYVPTAEYRLASFQRSKQPLTNIDIQVYWKNRLDGQLYPVQMFNSSSVSIKILFRRRGFNAYPHPASAGYNF